MKNCFGILPRPRVAFVAAVLLLPLPLLQACEACTPDVVVRDRDGTLLGDGGNKDGNTMDATVGDHASSTPDMTLTGCRGIAECDPGLLCVDGQCVAGCPDSNRCESGGTCCNEGASCQQGRCVAECANSRCGVHGELCCDATEVCVDDRCASPCTSGVRCGASLEMCCDAVQICFATACVTPVGSCSTQAQCAPGQVCDSERNVCIDEQDMGQCMYHPPVGEFDPVVEWHWQESTIEPTFNQVMMAPAVANLTDDNNDGLVDHRDIPDVVFSTFAGNAYTTRGVMRIVSGDSGIEHHVISNYNVFPPSCPAIADLDGDHVPEIVVDKQNEGSNVATYAFHADGTLFWEAAGFSTGTGGPAIANVNADAAPEVIVGNGILSSTGQAICRFPRCTSMPVAVDINRDGVQEVYTGAGIYRGVADVSGNCEVVWGGTCRSGGPAVANLDTDPEPELISSMNGQIYALNHDGTEIWHTGIPLDDDRLLNDFGISDCHGTLACSTASECTSPDVCYLGYCVHRFCRHGGGPITVADFDGDGLAELGLAARWYYLVYESDGSVLWAHKTKDFSSAVTGSSVFDFDGDGKAEVVYNDEAYLRVYKGSGGTVDADGDGYRDAEILVEIPNPSGTLVEYPLIVDVDADGRAEIILAANNYAFDGVTGMRAFGDVLDNWVETRRIWNQHSYHVTNVCDGLGPSCDTSQNTYGAVPTHEAQNWSVDWLNNYRQNVQGSGLFWAPDLQVLNTRAECAADMSVDLFFDVVNFGSRAVPAGVPVSVYLDAALERTVLSLDPLPPGSSEHFFVHIEAADDVCQIVQSIEIVADDRGDGSGRFNECENGGEDNNSAVLTGLSCATADLLLMGVDAQCGANQTIRLSFVVHNAGERFANSGVPISIYVNDVLEDTLLLPQSLLPHERVMMSWQWDIPVGLESMPLQIRVVVDESATGHGSVLECGSNAETNNSFSAEALVCRIEG